MPDKPTEPTDASSKAKKAWGQPDEPFYIGSTDGHGHSERGQNIKFQPWLMDAMNRLRHEIPAYKNQLNHVIRDLCTLGVKERIKLLSDDVRIEVERIFQLHLDMEQQNWTLNRMAEMQKYVDHCEATLRVYEAQQAWMFVSRDLEKMKQRLDEGLVWEPHASRARELIVEYEAKLRNAKFE